MKVDVIGPGAMGLHCALALPAEVQVTLRHPDFDTGRLDIADDGGRERRVMTRGLADAEPISAALVTTKAGQVEGALAACHQALAPDSEILLLHNGLGPQDRIAATLHAQQQLYVGVTTEGALRESPGRIRHTGQGTTLAGPWNDPVQPGPLIRCLQRSSLHLHWEPEPDRVRRAVWRKLIINCAINPLTALHNVPNGALLEERFRGHWETLTRLACRVAAAEGIDLDCGQMLEQVETVLHGTARNYSSMQQDVQYGRRTEAPEILGELIRRGRVHGLDMAPLADLAEHLEHRRLANGST